MYQYITIVKKLISETEYKIFLTIIIFIIFTIIRGMMGRLINKREQDFRRKYISRQTTNYILTFLFITALSVVWLRSFDKLLSFLGILSAGLIIAGKEFLMNLLSSIIILWRGLFEVGDRIEIGAYRGDVMNTGAMYITLAEFSPWDQGGEPSGRILKIPNGLILTNTVANYTTGLGLIWNEISFNLTLDSNWEKAQEIGLKIAKDIAYILNEQDWEKVKKNFEEFIYNQKEPKCYFEVSNSKITLTLRFISKLYNKRKIKDKFWQEFLKAIQNEADIKMC